MHANQPQDRNSGSKSDSNTTITWSRRPSISAQEWKHPLDYIDRNIYLFKDRSGKIQIVKHSPQEKRPHSEYDNKTSKANTQTETRQSLASKVRQKGPLEVNYLAQAPNKQLLNDDYTIDRVQRQIRSITFRCLHQRRMTSRQAELYYSKNILNNMRQLFLEALDQKNKNQSKPHHMEQQIQQLLVKELDQYLSAAIQASSKYYSGFLKTPITFKMQEAIPNISRRPNAKADIISRQSIGLDKYIQYQKEEMVNPASSYSKFITQVIDESWHVISTKNEVNNQNLGDKFTRFIERLYASSQLVPYQRMVHQISKKAYNAEIQTLNLFLQIFEDRELVKQVAVKEKGKGLEYAVSKIKFQSIDKYQKSKKRLKSQKEIVLQPLPTGWSQAKKLQIMQEWINEMESIFECPSKHILRSLQFKNTENIHISLSKEAKIRLIRNVEEQNKIMKKEIDQLRKKFQTVQAYLLKTSSNKPCQSTLGAMSAICPESMIDIMNHHLCILIHHLLIAGKHIETGLGTQHVNLISFTPSTLLSSKIQCNQFTFITILNTLTMLDQSVECLQKFKLLQVSNGFNESLNSLNIKFLLEETVKCSLELSFVDNGPKAIYYSHFSNFLRKISGFKFGSLACCAILLSQNEGAIMGKSEPGNGKNRKRQKPVAESDRKVPSTIHIKNPSMFICIKCQRLVVGEPTYHIMQPSISCNSCIIRENPEAAEAYVACQLKARSNSVAQILSESRLQSWNVIGLNCKTLQMAPFKASFDEVQNTNQIHAIDEDLLNLLDQKMPIQQTKSRTLNVKELNSTQNVYFQIKGENLADVLHNLQISFNKENIRYAEIKLKNYLKKKQIKRLIEEQADIFDFNQNRENYSFLLQYLKENKLAQNERSKNIKCIVRALHLPTIHLQNLDSSLMMLSNLEKIDLRDNKLKTLDISAFRLLTHLNANHNELMNIQLKSNKNLVVLQLSMNQLKNISLNHNINLTHLDLSHNQLKEINLAGASKLKKLIIAHNNINTNIDISKCPQLIYLDASYNYLLDMKVQKNWNITFINLGYNDIKKIDVKDLSNLTTLLISNAQLSQLDLSSNRKLTRLQAAFNKLEHLNLSVNPNLVELNVDANKLSAIDLSHNYQLSFLSIQTNIIKMLDLSNNIKLQKLDLRKNDLSVLNLAHNVNLAQLHLNHNKIKNIDLASNIKLSQIHLANNLLTSIDLTRAAKLQVLDVKYNQLEQIIMNYCQKATAQNFNLLQYNQSCFIVIRCSRQQKQPCMKFIDQLQGRYQQFKIYPDFYE